MRPQLDGSRLRFTLFLVSALSLAACFQPAGTLSKKPAAEPTYETKNNTGQLAVPIWKQLAEVDEGIGRQAKVLSTADALSSLWNKLGIRDPIPSIQWQDRVVLALETGYAGPEGCDRTMLRDIEITDDLVYADIWKQSEQGSPDRICDAWYAPRTYLVSIERSALPTTPFKLRTELDYEAELVVTAVMLAPDG